MEAPRWQRIIARIAVAVVALVAAIVSYEHMENVAAAAGELFSKVVPLSVDGLVVASSLSAFAARRHGVKISRMTLFSLIVSLTVSVGANVLSPFLPRGIEIHNPVLLAVVGAWPAIALALAFESLLHLNLPAKTRESESEESAPQGVTPVATATEPVAPSAPVVTAYSGSSSTLIAPDAPGVTSSTELDAPDTSSVTNGKELDTLVVGSSKLAAASAAAPSTDSATASRSAASDSTSSRPVTEPAATADTYDKSGSKYGSPPPSSNTHYTSDVIDDREQARQLFLQNPSNWTGKSLGERFGRSPSWGRERMREVRVPTI